MHRPSLLSFCSSTTCCWCWWWWRRGSAGGMWAKATPAVALTTLLAALVGVGAEPAAVKPHVSPTHPTASPPRVPPTIPRPADHLPAGGRPGLEQCAVEPALRRQGAACRRALRRGALHAAVLRAALVYADAGGADDWPPPFPQRLERLRREPVRQAVRRREVLPGPAGLRRGAQLRTPLLREPPSPSPPLSPRSIPPSRTEWSAVPRQEIMPAMLKRGGYKTHMLGKCAPPRRWPPSSFVALMGRIAVQGISGISRRRTRQRAGASMTFSASYSARRRTTATTAGVGTPATSLSPTSTVRPPFLPR